MAQYSAGTERQRRSWRGPPSTWSAPGRRTHRGGSMQYSIVIGMFAAGAAAAGCAPKPGAEPVATPRTSTQRIESEGKNILLTPTGDAFVSSIRLPNSPTRVFQVLPLALTELG